MGTAPLLSDLKRVTAGELSLCVRDSGCGPAVVFLHGTSANLGVWDSVVAALDSRVRTIAVDQRGHGRSDKPVRGYDAVAHCSDLHGLIATLGCAPVTLVGHSLGARNAIVFGATYPELVKAVVAVDYTPYVEKEVLDELYTRVRGGDRTFESTVELEHYLRNRYPKMPCDAIERRIAYGYTETEGGVRALADPEAMLQTVDGLRNDFVNAMRDINLPTTLLRGEHSNIVSSTAFEMTTRLRSDVRAIEITGVDHYVAEEYPGVVAREISLALNAAGSH